MTPRAVLPLGLAALGLAGVLALELRPGAAPPRAPAAAGTVPAGPGAAEAVSPARLAATLERPLFAPSRRPPAPAAAPLPPEAAPAPLPRLAGVTTVGGEARAIFALAPDRTVAVGPGGHVGELQVRGIAGDAVTVEGPGGTRVLRLAFLPPSAAPAAADPPASPAGPPGLGLLGMPPIRFGPGGLPLPVQPGGGRP